ncbi:MAG: hypothetical protein IPM92_09685 [Saprospiraceae bacterium]|nr:hypothetical protein [Saprospiraceae bacterium]
MNWYDKTNDKLNEKITDSDNISEEEMEKLKAGNIIKDIILFKRRIESSFFWLVEILSNFKYALYFGLPICLFPNLLLYFQS